MENHCQGHKPEEREHLQQNRGPNESPPYSLCFGAVRRIDFAGAVAREDANDDVDANERRNDTTGVER